jgi:hypothetical protein
MQNPPHTIRRNNILVYRRRYPTEVCSAESGQFFQFSLKTGDTKLGIRRINDWGLPKQFQDKVDALFAAKSGGYDALSIRKIATDSEAIQVIRDHYVNRMKQAEINLSHSLLPVQVGTYAEQIADSLARIFRWGHQFAKSAFEKFVNEPDWVRAVAGHESEFAVNILRPDPIAPKKRDITLARIILEHNGFRVEPGSEAERAAANASGRGVHEIYKLWRARAQSDYGYKVND